MHVPLLSFYFFKKFDVASKGTKLTGRMVFIVRVPFDFCFKNTSCMHVGKT